MTSTHNFSAKRVVHDSTGQVGTVTRPDANTGRDQTRVLFDGVDEPVNVSRNSLSLAPASVR